MREPRPIFAEGRSFQKVTIVPTTLEIRSNTPLELYGEPQSGKTFYGMWLVKKLSEQKNCKVLVIRCEKFDSGFLEAVCEEFDFNPDIVDVYPPSSPKDLMTLFGMDDRRFKYEVDSGSGKIEMAFLDQNPFETVKNSTIGRYGLVFVDTLTSVFNIMTNAGLKNFPPRNQYEQILFTLVELYSLGGGLFISTHEHTRDVTKPYSSIEVKGGKEVERRHDHVLRLSSAGSGANKDFTLYAKRWPLLPEGILVCRMKYKRKEFVAAEG